LRTHIKAGLIFSAILITCACIHGADTIELPFDYFYGRWTTGHFLDGRVALTDADPQGRTDYSYTSDRNRIGLDDIREYLVVSQQSDYGLGTPWLYYYFRPASNWQIGIDNLCYHESYGLIVSSSTLAMGGIDRTARIDLVSDWMSTSFATLRVGLMPFLYRYGLTVGDGGVSANSRISLVHNKFGIDDFGDLWRATSSGYMIKAGHVFGSENQRVNEWSFENNLQWGISDVANLALDLGLIYTTTSQVAHRYEDAFDEAVSRYYFNQIFKRVYRPSYGLSGFLHLFSPLIIKGEFCQVFEKVSVHDDGEIVAPGYETQVTESKHSGDLQESRTNLSLSAYYITEGEFDPGIVLDDYNGFYRNMLFHNQFQAGIESSYRKVGAAGVINDEFESLELSAAYGRWNKMEVNLSGSYERALYLRWSPRTRESVRTEVIVKYRSYTYRPGEGPGWSRDDRYDILFGVTPQFGQVYVEAKYTPPVYTGYYRDEVGFLAFRNLEKGQQSQLDLETSFGLGRKFVLTNNHVVSYLHGSLSNHKYAFNLRHRVRNVELSLQYEEIYVNSGFDDATITGRLRILL
jgi:hypothetical protein